MVSKFSWSRGSFLITGNFPDLKEHLFWKASAGAVWGMAR